jgi:hypothetical protein
MILYTPIIIYSQILFQSVYHFWDKIFRHTRSLYAEWNLITEDAEYEESQLVVS